MKRYFYLLVVLCTALFGLTSCEDMFKMDVEGMYVPQEIIVERDTVRIITPIDPIVYVIPSDRDTVIIITPEVWVYVDTTGVTPPIVKEEKYKLGSNKVDNESNYTDLQPTQYFVNDVLKLGTDVNREAEVRNEIDTMFLPKVSSFATTVSAPETNSKASTRGDYDINTGYRNYTVAVNDGSTYKVDTETESASGVYDGKQKDLLYRMVKGIRVLSVDNKLLTDSIVRGKTIYRKANRTMKVEVESLNRPLMGPEIVTLDTLTISSLKAAPDNDIAVVYVEDGEIPDPEPTPEPTPDPPTPKPDDPGYKPENEPIRSISFSYVISPDKTLKECLLIRTDNYVVPVISKNILSAVRVNNPGSYNSCGWVNDAWAPAQLILSDGFVWFVDGQPVANATDATIDWLCKNSGISKIARGDFLKNASFVNKENTTLVYVDNRLYMVLPN